MTLPVEIERRFLLLHEPPDLSSARQLLFQQGYLAIEEERQVRLRQEGDLYMMTCKQGHGMERVEVEVALTRGQFDALWPLTQGRRLEKTRFFYPWNDVTLEIDLYHGRHAPLRIAEVEFSNREAALAFEKPPFFGEDVTGRKEYSNAVMALTPAPDAS